jgi:hypothetical protein
MRKISQIGQLGAIICGANHINNLVSQPKANTGALDE